MSTVLIVEDNLAHAKLAALLLERAGYAVLQAGTAEVGIKLTLERQPDLVLMDIQLPGMDGLSAIRQIKADPRTQAIAVVAVTSFTSAHPESEALAAGAADFIAKPYHYKDFLAVVARLLP